MSFNFVCCLRSSVAFEMLLLGAGIAQAQSPTTLTCDIPLPFKSTASNGMGDIPPGQFYFQVNVIPNGLVIASTFSAIDSSLTWVPLNGSPTTFVTTTPGTQFMCGALSGMVFFTQYMMGDYTAVSSFYTSNARFTSDAAGYPMGYPNNQTPAPHDPYAMLPETDSDYNSPPASFPAQQIPYFDLPGVTIHNYRTGYIWFTSDNPQVAVYILDANSGLSTRIDQPYLLSAAPGGGFPSGLQLSVSRVAGPQTGIANVKIRYRSVDSVSPNGNGDSIDTYRFYFRENMNLNNQ